MDPGTPFSVICAGAQRVARASGYNFVLVDDFSAMVGDRAGVAVFEPVDAKHATGTRVTQRCYRQRG
eukprot:CAMPEP_0197399334 /NCGR_PEP_ID=MMETSP1165-20131217/14990_1 /TAXON_ID=284809 /ORGANISM="Chrysocystis fragilis, Strain CCMP3189" /LENGTH=66 /DNA_ID=CAMNT_0042925329 /DNA_START=182 /DNA_END=382 /DNA_ORIENTATION=-